MKELIEVVAQLKEYEGPTVTEMERKRTEGPGKQIRIRFKLKYDERKFLEENPRPPREMRKWKDNPNYPGMVISDEIEKIVKNFLDFPVFCWGTEGTYSTVMDFEIEKDVTQSDAIELEEELENYLNQFDWLVWVEFRHILAFG